MKINKTACTIIVLIIWTVFSIGYICVFKVNEFKLNQMNGAAQQGYQQAIIDVGAAANKCDSNGVPLNVGTDKDGKVITVTIVGVSCLQQQQPAAATPATPAATKK